MQSLSIRTLVFCLPILFFLGCRDEMGPLMDYHQVPIDSILPPPHAHAPAPPINPMDATEDISEIVDFREQFCGTFAFATVQRTWNIITGQTTFSDTAWYVGSVEMVQNSSDLLLIRYLPGNNTVLCGLTPVYGAWVTPTVDASGALTHELIPFCSSASHFFGNASLSSITFEAQTGGQSFTSAHLVTGWRL